MTDKYKVSCTKIKEACFSNAFSSHFPSTDVCDHQPFFDENGNCNYTHYVNFYVEDGRNTKYLIIKEGQKYKRTVTYELLEPILVKDPNSIDPDCEIDKLKSIIEKYIEATNILPSELGINNDR